MHNISSYSDMEIVYNNPGFYIILSDYNIKSNDSKCNIKYKNKNIKAIYRGQANSRKDRLIGHLFNEKYNKSDKNFIKINNDNGINIDKEPYSKYSWVILTCSMHGTNQQIRICAETAFDLVFEKPMYSNR